MKVVNKTIDQAGLRGGGGSYKVRRRLMPENNSHRHLRMMNMAMSPATEEHEEVVPDTTSAENSKPNVSENDQNAAVEITEANNKKGGKKGKANAPPKDEKEETKTESEPEAAKEPTGGESEKTAESSSPQNKGKKNKAKDVKTDDKATDQSAAEESAVGEIEKPEEQAAPQNKGKKNKAKDMLNAITGGKADDKASETSTNDEKSLPEGDQSAAEESTVGEVEKPEEQAAPQNKGKKNKAKGMLNAITGGKADDKASETSTNDEKSLPEGDQSAAGESTVGEVEKPEEQAAPQNKGKKNKAKGMLNTITGGKADDKASEASTNDEKSLPEGDQSAAEESTVGEVEKPEEQAAPQNKGKKNKAKGTVESIPENKPEGNASEEIGNGEKSLPESGEPPEESTAGKGDDDKTDEKVNEESTNDEKSLPEGDQSAAEESTGGEVEKTEEQTAPQNKGKKNKAKGTVESIPENKPEGNASEEIGNGEKSLPEGGEPPEESTAGKGDDDKEGVAKAEEPPIIVENKEGDDKTADTEEGQKEEGFDSKEEEPPKNIDKDEESTGEGATSAIDGGETSTEEQSPEASVEEQGDGEKVASDDKASATEDAGVQDESTSDAEAEKGEDGYVANNQQVPNATNAKAGESTRGDNEQIIDDNSAAGGVDGSSANDTNEPEKYGGDQEANAGTPSSAGIDEHKDLFSVEEDQKGEKEAVNTEDFHQHGEDASLSMTQGGGGTTLDEESRIGGDDKNEHDDDMNQDNESDVVAAKDVGAPSDEDSHTTNESRISDSSVVETVDEEDVDKAAVGAGSSDGETYDAAERDGKYEATAELGEGKGRESPSEDASKDAGSEIESAGAIVSGPDGDGEQEEQPSKEEEETDEKGSDSDEDQNDGKEDRADSRDEDGVIVDRDSHDMIDEWQNGGSKGDDYTSGDFDFDALDGTSLDFDADVEDIQASFASSEDNLHIMDQDQGGESNIFDPGYGKENVEKLPEKWWDDDDDDELGGMKMSIYLAIGIFLLVIYLSRKKRFDCPDPRRAGYMQLSHDKRY